ncbi:MAG: regulatory protein RecX [Vicinamibacteria bacterium]
MSSDDSLPDSDADASARKAQTRDAFALILAKLGRRDHTEKELERALLRKEYPPEAIEIAIGRAKREGLVNDVRLAGVIARITARSGKRGPRKVVATLRQKGVCAELAQAATKEAFSSTDEGEENTIRFVTRLLERARGETAKDKRIRVLRSLLTRGFELDEARRVVRIAENALMTENASDDDVNSGE